MCLYARNGPVGKMVKWSVWFLLAVNIQTVLSQQGCESPSWCCELGGWCGNAAFDQCTDGNWNYQVPCSPTYRTCCLPTTVTPPSSIGPTDPPTTPTTTPPYTGPSTTPGPTPTPFEGCGQRSVSSYIVGGVEAAPHSWPWMVSLQLDYFGWGGWRHHCGGSIVHPQWMVTAAHCIAKSGVDSPRNFKVILGMHYKDQQTGNEIEMPIETAIVHENYRTDIPGSPFDVAVVKFVTPIDYNRYMSPVCLPTNKYQNFTANECFITGWGLTQGTGNENVLNEARINVITNEVCDNKWETGSGRVGLIKESHICAGNGVPGTCNGDSGGPLVCKEGGNWILAGATSFGAAGCVAENAPDVYTRISYYTDWINDKIQNN